MPAADHELLCEYLMLQRRHVLEAVDGLDDTQMTRAVLPSGWSPVQLLHHLALDDERFWVRSVIAGDDEARAGLSDNAWVVPDGLSVADVLALYQREAEASDAVLAVTDLDAPPGWWPEFLGDQTMDSARDVLLHLIVETAAHAGHLDAVRELTDGRQWRVVTG